MEYAGRTKEGEKKKSILDRIPAVPYSINPSFNAENEEQVAHEKQKRKELAVNKFNARMQRRVDRRHRRDETAHLMHLKRQEEVYKKVIND